MIPVKNVYYMLSYAFKALQEKGYRSVETEAFDNVAELCAAILTKGVAMQVKRGLGQAYINRTESLSGIRGKLELSESIKGQALMKRHVICTYDDFSVDTIMNRIIKSTLLLLLRSEIAKAWKREIRKCLVFLGEVQETDLYHVDWRLRFDRNNHTYRMLISICRLAVNGLLQTQAGGSAKLMQFEDAQRMCRLYERFILEYYRKEHPELRVSASQIPWQLDDNSSDLLPVMQTDVMLARKEKVLILDAKYYAHTLQSQYDKRTLHSANLYQIFTYVKNKEAELAGRPHEVSGLLLYAKTDEAALPNNTYSMSGNRIGARTLDLSGSFQAVRDQLDGIVAEFLG